MKAKDFFSQEIDSLKKILKKKQFELKEVKLSVAFKKEKDIKKNSKIKKDIARLLTILNYKYKNLK